MVNVLVVCTGNLRRSPAIEAMLRQGVAGLTGLEERGITVGSAGTRAVVGAGVDPLLEAQLGRLGIDSSAHAARQLTAKQIRQADLVLTAAREHRRAVVRLVPAAVQHTFTVLELVALGERVGRAGLGGADVASRLGDLVERAPFERAARVVRKAEVDDLADLRRPNARAAARLMSDLRAPAEALLRLLEPDSVLSIVGSEPTGETEARRTLRLPLG